MKGAWDYWAPFAALDRTSGTWFPTGFEQTRDQAWYVTDQVPMRWTIFRWLEPLINQGEEYEKLPRVIPYVVLPLGCALILVRVRRRRPFLRIVQGHAVLADRQPRGRGRRRGGRRRAARRARPHRTSMRTRPTPTGRTAEIMDVVLLFAMIIGLLLVGVPIAVSLGFSSIVFLLAFSDTSLASIAQSFYQAMAGHYTLLAIPFFILASSLHVDGRRGAADHPLLHRAAWATCAAGWRSRASSPA